MSLDIKFTWQGFKNSCWIVRLCWAICEALSSSGSLISKDPNLAFHLYGYLFFNSSNWGLWPNNPFSRHWHHKIIKNFEYKIVNNIMFLLISFNICFGRSKEPSQRDGSFEYQHYVYFGAEIRKIFLNMLSLQGDLSFKSQCMRFPTMWYVQPAKLQISLRICTVWSEPLLVTWVFYDC